MRNTKKVICVIILVLLGIGVFFLVKLKIKEIEKLNIEEEKRREDEYFRMMQEMNIPKRESELLEMVIKGEWGEAREYFSKEFRKKHKENESVLDIKIDEFNFDGTYVGDGVNESGWNVRQYIIKSGDKRYRYYLLPKYNYDEHPDNFDIPVIDDIQIIDVIDLDNEDKENIQGVRFTEDTSGKLLYQMMFTYDGEAGLSKHFREKYPNFDGFYDRKGLPVKYILFNGKERDNYTVSFGNFNYNNKIIENLKIDDLYRGFRYIYNLYFTLDNNCYLDDYSFELVSKENNPNITPEYYLYKNPTSGEIIEFLSISEHDWSGLPISYKFKEKYNSKDGIFPNLEIDWVEFICKSQGVTKYPVCIHLQDGSKKYYGLIFKLTETNLIDDIEKIELNVDNDKNYTAEELMNMF